MIRSPRPKVIRKRPRIFQHPRTTVIHCGDNEWYCPECMENFAAEAEYYRPGHVWAIDDGKVIFLEDVVVEHRLGRKLNKNEMVIHKNGDVMDNRDDNLEVVEIEKLETDLDSH